MEVIYKVDVSFENSPTGREKLFIGSYKYICRPFRCLYRYPPRGYGPYGPYPPGGILRIRYAMVHFRLYRIFLYPPPSWYIGWGRKMAPSIYFTHMGEEVTKTMQGELVSPTSSSKCAVVNAFDTCIEGIKYMMITDAVLW